MIKSWRPCQRRLLRTNCPCHIAFQQTNEVDPLFNGRGGGACRVCRRTYYSICLLPLEGWMRGEISTGKHQTQTDRPKSRKRREKWIENKNRLGLARAQQQQHGACKIILLFEEFKYDILRILGIVVVVEVIRSHTVRRIVCTYTTSRVFVYLFVSISHTTVCPYISVPNISNMTLLVCMYIHTRAMPDLGVGTFERVPTAFIPWRNKSLGEPRDDIRLNEGQTRVCHCDQTPSASSFQTTAEGFQSSQNGMALACKPNLSSGWRR